MATTRYGVTGPMTAYGTFTAKAAGGASGGTMLPLMGAGSLILWLLGYGR